MIKFEGPFACTDSNTPARFVDADFMFVDAEISLLMCEFTVVFLDFPSAIAAVTRQQAKQRALFFQF